MLEGFLDVHLRALRSVQDECPLVAASGLHVVWATGSTQWRNLDVRFPYQARERVHAFNRNVSSRLRTGWRGIFRSLVCLDWMNLTRGARSFDGLHFVTDVNLVKARALLALMRLLRSTSDGHDESVVYCS